MLHPLSDSPERTDAYFQAEAEGLSEKDPDERVFVYTGGFQRTGWTEDERVRCTMSRVFGACGRDVGNDNGKRLLLSFAKSCKLALTNTFFIKRKSGISHDPKRIAYILRRQAHRPNVQDVKVVPQPSAPPK